MGSTVDYLQVKHVIDEQIAAEEAFLAEFQAGEYTLYAPLIKLNAYLIAPLTAVVMFKTQVKAEATVTIWGKRQGGNVVHTFPAATEHILPVYGLYADYENTVEMVLSTGERQLLKIKTAPLPEGVPKSTYIYTTAEYMGSNLMFLTAAMKAMPAGYDYQGEVRWYATRNFAFDLKRLANGHILVGTERLVKMPYFTTGLYEMAFSGKIFREYVIPCGGYHHDQFEMEDGNLLVLTFDFYSDTVEDECVLLDRQTGEILKKWDYKDILPHYPVAGSGSQDAHDWFHNNAVWYDEKTHSLTLSGRHQDVVINIDFDSGQLNWIIGDPTSWPEEYQKYFFRPIGDIEHFAWQYEQHACVVTPTGDVMLFDNGHYRSKDPAHYRLNSQNFSRGVRYHIDTDAMTIEQVWQYGQERGADFFSPYISNVEYYNEGHYLIHSGGIGYKDGQICDGFACVEMLDPGEHVYKLNSITCEWLNGQILYEMHVPANYYRAEKLPLYYAGETAELGRGQILGQLIETQTTALQIKAQEHGTMVPDEYRLRIVEEDDRVLVNGYYEEGMLAQILLQSSTEIRRYTIPTQPESFEAMCVGSFQKTDSKEVDVFINKTGLQGIYRLSLLLQTAADTYEIFTTGITIHC